MARPTTYASPICIALSVIAALGIVVGLLADNPLVLALVLLPVVAYEIYRVEGGSTIWASRVMGLVLLLLVASIAFGWEFNVAEFLGRDEAEVGGYVVLLGDVRTLGAVMIGALAIVLFTRTRGIYTRWLAAIIIATVLPLVYLLNPETFHDLLRQSADDAIGRL